MRRNWSTREYTNTPVGLNFLLAGYAYSEGKIAFDPALSVSNGQFRTNTELLAYSRALDVFGVSAKIAAFVPYSSFSGHAVESGKAIEREMSGFNEPRFRFSINFYGAPALSVKDFASYHQDLIIGASLQVTPPLGQYDDKKVVNLGNNRWSFKPELGISKALGPWTLELVPSAIFFTDTTDFFSAARSHRRRSTRCKGISCTVLNLVFGLRWTVPSSLEDALPSTASRATTSRRVRVRV
jgi:hypothetical protein